jgi:hypothetical protein
MPADFHTGSGLPDDLPTRIHLIRGERVMLSIDLAPLYGVPVKALVQAVIRNRERFPPDFMFQLTSDEWSILKSQFVTSSRRQHRDHADLCAPAPDHRRAR